MAKTRAPKKTNPRGAPRKVNPDMTERHSIRTNATEGEDWHQRAAGEGRNFSDWARRMIRIALGQPPERAEDRP